MTPTERASVVLAELKQLYPTSKTALNYSNNWELLVAVMLSAQTTDKQVNVVTKQLFSKYQTLHAYTQVSLEEFTNDIRSIGLYKTKAKNILATANIIAQKHNGDIPKNFSDLIALPGVGRKTANVVLGHAHGIAEGIAVDTHVKRLAKKFGLTQHSDPKKIEQDLMKILPKKEWILFTNRMIDYGRDYSPARKADDSSDPISQKLYT